jgi:hypothetical protein
MLFQRGIAPDFVPHLVTTILRPNIATTPPIAVTVESAPVAKIVFRFVADFGFAVVLPFFAILG